MDKKLSISSQAFFKTYPYNGNLIHMQKIIEGIFINYGILTSSIFISEYPKLIIFQFNILLKIPNQYNIIGPITRFIKSLFVLKYNKNIRFDITISKNIYCEDKYISSWLKYKLLADPNRVRFLLQKLFKDVK